MGRPLFSARQPAVRVQPKPQPQHPAYEKWTYANAFDPDSDEFFENDDAVYEAFIEPGQQIQIPISADRARTAIVDADAGSNSGSSSASSSGRGSPMELVNTDAFHREGEARADTIDDARVRSPTLRNPALDAQIEAGRGLPAEERVQYYLSLIDRMVSAREQEREPREARPSVRDRVPTYLDLPSDESRTSTPELVSRAPASPLRPSTPPAQSTPHLASPSPPPSVTPRLYTWTARPVMPPPASPLTNRVSRVSVARMAPVSLVPVHRAA
ncbi:hypothetical protein C8Q78DRAFT_1006588 [Trametes maxima]|nr:hypothetical protein C8Q78DRAFT_1006588 [Trametes maxima]